jgi:vacuolar-type H+-ATPase subunit E/Vma4
MARRDRALNESSGYPALLAALTSEVVDPAKASAAHRSAADARSAIDLVRSGLTAEQQMLVDPSRRNEALADLDAAKERLEHLKGPGARWGVLVGDRVSDLSTAVNFRLRGNVRDLLRSTEERLETLKTPEEWDDVVRDVQTAIASHVTAAFVAIEEGATATRQEVVELLKDEDLGTIGGGRSGPPVFDVQELWTDKALDPKEGRGKVFKSGLTGLKGAQGGVMMFGMMGQFLPGAATALLATNPVLLGVGAVFGGMQLFDEKKRKVASRRQSARGQIRQFLDDVQFEIGNEISSQIRDIQRALRDEFTERLAELQRTYTDTARRAQASAEQDAGSAQERLTAVTAALGQLGGVEQALAAAVGS